MTTDEIMKLADAYATQMIHAHYHPTNQARATLLKAVEELARDAARYRWLRDKSDKAYLRDGADDYGWFPSNAEEIDDACDEGLKETP